MAERDIRAYNRDAWDKEVSTGNPWTVPVSSEQIEEARAGRWSIVLTETKPIPASWFPPLAGADVMCLASGGGQQGPILAAVGARVTVFDNSPAQLGRDRLVADRDGLDLRTVEGDMRDLSAFADGSFDLIVHPVSNIFIPDVLPVWHEAHRVLRSGGVLLSGCLNPATYLFDRMLEEQGVLQVRFPLPYADISSMSEEERVRTIGADNAYEWSHTLTDLIGGQLDAGFTITDFYEDRHKDLLLAQFTATYFATRAVRSAS